MDAYFAGRANSTYLDQPPVVIIGTSDSAMTRAERSIRASGLRVGAMVPIDQAAARLEIQGLATALWVEVDRDGGEPMDGVLRRINRDVADRRYSAVISATSDLVDPVSAAVDEPLIEVLVGADDAQRSAALALAVASGWCPQAVGDMASDQNAERLRQLSDEVGRIASTLARL